MNFIDVCRRLIALDTTPTHGSRECAHYVADLSRKLGFEVSLFDESVNGVEQSNIVLRCPGADREELLLQTHLDTAEAGIFRLWTRTDSNPFNASIYGDTLYGLGAADTKLDFACKLEAARKFLNRKLQRPFALAGTFGAQAGMAGALRMIRQKQVSAKMALVGEPTQLRLASRGQGLATVEVEIPFSIEEIEYRHNHDLVESSTSQSKMFRGRFAHSSAPTFGENAIIKMLDYLVELPSGIAIMDMDGGLSYNTVPASAFLEIDMVGGFRESVVPKIAVMLKAMRTLESEFQKGADHKGVLPPTLNVGQIRTFDDHIQIIVSCRIPADTDRTDYEKWLDTFKTACEGQGATFRVRDLKTPFETPPNSFFLQGCRQILSELEFESEPQSIASTTEASVFTRLGIECLVFGPGQSVGNSHEPNERVNIQELHQATQFYERVIERFCL